MSDGSESNPLGHVLTKPPRRAFHECDRMHPMTSTPRLDRLTRKPDRGTSNRARLDALLDDQLVATVSSVVDGQPWMVPLLYARDGDRVLIHGSTGAGLLRHFAEGAPACLGVFALDGLVVAESTFESSANYRSAVLRGIFEVLTGRAAHDALNILSDKILPGRTSEVRPSTAKEVAATVALALPIEEGSWLYKERTGLPGEPAEEVAPTTWMGVVPFRTVRGPAEPAPWTGPEAPVPDSVRRVIERG